MKKYFCIFILLAGQFSSAQDKSAKIDLGKNDLIRIIHLPQSGLAVIDGKSGKTASSQFHISYYDSDLTKVYDLTPENFYVWNFPANWIIASPGGDFLYFINGKKGVIVNETSNNISGYHFEILQIKKDGSANKMQIEKGDYGYSLATFCDKNYLYVLASENGDENSFKEDKKASEKIFLNRFNNSDMGYKRIELTGLPEIKSHKEYTFWNYATHTDNAIYLFSKGFDEVRQTCFYQIVKINSDGKVQKITPIKCMLDLGFQFSYSSNDHYFDLTGNIAEIYNEDFKMESSGNPNLPGHLTPTLNAFSDVLVDDAGGAVYIYGKMIQFGDKKSEKRKGFFVQKYDLNTGKLIWSTQQELSEEVMASKNLDKAFGFGTLEISFNVLPDQTMRLIMGGGVEKYRVTYLLSESGKIQDYFRTDFPNRYPNYYPYCIPPDVKAPSEKYIAKEVAQSPEVLKTNANIFFNLYRFNNSQRVIVMKHDVKEGKIDLNLFTQ